MKWKANFYLTIFAAVCLPSLQAVADTDWWENASLYQIYPRSFQDSDGDGVGDLKGITSRLEYLKQIGVTATWLSPIFESPMADFGYDISNFTRIDPIFGSLEDFDEMIAKAKELGVKIILDFVPNHSSDESVWFQKSINREEGFEDFYVWHDGKIDPEDSNKRLPPSNWISIFGGSMWTWNDQRQQFYLHQFINKQPDLNFLNPKVRQEMLKVLQYWLDRGVDGFRIDAVPHILEKRNDDGSYPDEPVIDASADPNSWNYHDHVYTKDQYGTIELLYEWRAFLEEYQKKNGGETRVLLAESYSPLEFLDLVYSNGTHQGVQIPMNFQLMYLDEQSNAKDVENNINTWMEIMWKNHKIANWVVGNHDNDRVANRMGKHKVDLLNIIVHSLPGAPVTYYGEEIGMANIVPDCSAKSCESRDAVRSPMQWQAKENAGFTPGSSSWLPLNEDYQVNNVETELKTGRSTLHLYKELQELKKTSAFKNTKNSGGFSYKAVTEQIFQIIRAIPGEEEYITLVNMGDNVEYVDNLSDKTFEYILASPYSPHNKGDEADLSGRIYLMPYEAVVLRWIKQ